MGCVAWSLAATPPYLPIGEAVSSKTSFTKACGQQVGLPDEAFYFLNLATLGEPDVTMGHSSPTSHLVSASE